MWTSLDLVEPFCYRIPSAVVFKEANTGAYNSEVARVIARFEDGDVILQISLQSQAQGFFSCSLEQIL